ncbi:hypothetical protein CDD83_8434 [Cordyceps sp. RAO-2017]|nr:hypothetical protein CDD83_8434 [Cordyceps sp. RAO-2017]
MASPGDEQALAATFLFAIVAAAAVATSFLYFRGGVSSLLRDGPRLVLIGFLATSFLWALVGFIATFLRRAESSGCQATVAFAAVFDQLARMMLEEFIFWAMKCDLQASLAIILPQVVFLVRFILGGVFVGVQRPQFKPVCVGITISTPLAIVVLVADAVIVVMLLVRASSVGIFRDIQEKTALFARSRALLLVTLGLVIWISMSVPMILGMETFDIIVRTVLPAIGSLVVLALIAVLRSTPLEA